MLRKAVAVELARRVNLRFRRVKDGAPSSKPTNPGAKVVFGSANMTSGASGEARTEFNASKEPCAKSSLPVSAGFGNFPASALSVQSTRRTPSSRVKSE